MNQTTSETPVFIDWITLRQDHFETHSGRVATGLARAEDWQDLPEVYGSVRASAEKFEVAHSEDGKVFYLLSSDEKKQGGYCFRSIRHEGSHSTSVQVRSDGRRVTLSGNPGRLDRPDNLFNYGLGDTVAIANSVMQQRGLPDFTFGQQFMRETISETDKRKGVSFFKWSGAVVDEIHVTRNYYAGSDALAIETMRDFRGRRMARVSKAAYGDETIQFGMPSKKGQRLHKGLVIYRKGPELLAHAKGDDAKKAVKASPEYQLAMDCGLVRVELKLGSHFLRENNLRYLGDMTMGKLLALYNETTAPLLLARASDESRLVENMPNKLRMTALCWINGQDVRAFMAPATFKRHRKALLEYGLDITEPRTLTGRPNAEEALQRMLDALPQHSLKPLDCPDWYGLPDVRKVA